MSNSAKVYNVGETSLPLNNTSGYVLAEKIRKYVQKLAQGEKVTAMVCYNAE